jgi:asparagine synthase (glutamine-hydrolysing)
VEQFWDLRFDAIRPGAVEDLKKMVLGKMEEAVKRWTLSDVPIACSLSGGLDSSSVVGMMAKSGCDRVRTYSLGFEGKGEEVFSELGLARKVAQKWETEHHELVMNPNQLLSDLGRMVWHLDEPYAGGLPSWYVFKLIGQDCKVAMTGTGGDELFGNYGKWERYEAGTLQRWYVALRELKHWGLRQLFRDAERYPHGHFYYRYLSDAAKNELVLGQGYGDRSSGTEELLEGLWLKAKTQSPRNAVAYVDFHLQLPEEFLLMTDRFSMAHSVEARVPFLDHELVECVYTIPPEIRTRRGDAKYFIREIVKDLLPPELWSAPKRGFVLPLQLWTRQDLKPVIEQVLSPGYLQKQGIFLSRVWERIVKPHLTGARDYTQQVWTLFMFQMWHENLGSGKCS